jgi:hypothetical protein
MLYRSGHIYLLMGSLLNLLLGLHLTETRAGWRHWVSRAGSALIVVAPVVFLAGFATEPERTDFNRPFAASAIYGCVLGVVLHAISRIGSGPPQMPYQTT